MVQEGFLSEDDLANAPRFPASRVDYPAVIAFKEGLFQTANERFVRGGTHGPYHTFCQENAEWLEDFSLFVALRAHFGGRPWDEWPQPLRDREPEAIQAARKDLAPRMEREKFLQYLFFHQWSSLKSACNEQGIQLIGDIPIYVTYDSVDVWSRPELFKLDIHKRPISVAGVPPDYFSASGQLWGNPVYDWDAMKARGYEWWARRVSRNLQLFDLVRMDHFRGFVAYWEVRASETSAIHGNWVEVPALDFFDHLLKQFPGLPLIAEDLGYITPDVIEVMDHYQFPGMKLLIFAFGEDMPTNPYIPHNVEQNCVFYTGTHDNNTIRGWFETEATAEERNRVFQYMGRAVSADEIHWEMIRLVMMSAANTAIFPMQDVLGLGREARMNRPATTDGNWGWRLLPEQITRHVTEKLAQMTKTYGRA